MEGFRKTVVRPSSFINEKTPPLHLWISDPLLNMLWDNPANAAYFHRRGKKIQLKTFFQWEKIINLNAMQLIDWIYV